MLAIFCIYVEGVFEIFDSSNCGLKFKVLELELFPNCHASPKVATTFTASPPQEIDVNVDLPT